MKKFEPQTSWQKQSKRAKSPSAKTSQYDCIIARVFPIRIYNDVIYRLNPEPGMHCYIPKIAIFGIFLVFNTIYINKFKKSRIILKIKIL